MRFAVAAVVAGAPALAQDCGFDDTVGDPGATRGNIAALTVYDDGDGDALYGAGSFTLAGGAPANRIAKWDGATWSPLGTGISSDFATCLGVFQDQLYVGGFFGSVGGEPGTSNLAAWDGNEWSATGAGLFGTNAVWSFGNFDDGNGEALYIGGSFTSIGGEAANRIARFDGETFEPLGTGLTRGVATIALDMDVFDDGTGPALFVCGRFGLAGGIPSALVAKWNGTEWESLDGGLDGTQCVNLTVYDDGNGAKLYASGSSLTPPGQPTCSVACWDGESWTSLGGTLGNLVWDLFPYDDGTGEALYAVGAYDDDDLDLFMKWDGEQWIDLGYEFNASIFEARSFDDGNGPGVFVAGSFTQGGGLTPNRIVKLDACAACAADCNGDGGLNILDFVCFQNEWNAQTAAGDCDGNGAYNILDFVCYQNLFAAGCP